MKGYRTVIFNGLVGAAAFLDWLLGGGLIQQIITDPADAALAVTVLTAVNLVLRRITTTPIGSKE